MANGENRPFRRLRGRKSLARMRQLWNARRPQPTDAPAAPPNPEPPPEPEDDTLRRVSDTAWRLILIGVVAALLLWGLSYISVVVIPTLLAVFLTALLMPPTHWLRQKGLGRGSSTAIVFLGSLVIFGLVIYLIVDRAVAGVPDLVDSVSEAIVGTQDWLLGLGLDAEVLNTFVVQAQDRAQTWLQDNAEQLVGGAWTGALAVGQVVFAILLVLVLTIYFLHSGDELMKWVGSLFPERSRRLMLMSGEIAFDVMGRYVRGVALVGFFDAIGIGLLLLVLSMFGMFDLNLAVPLIVLTFIGAFLPVVGAVVTGALAAIVAWVTAGWIIGLVVLVWVIFIQQLESNLFAPRIYGRALELPSPVVLLGISVGAIVGNLVGMFLATPVVAVAAGLLRNRPLATIDQEMQAKREARMKEAQRTASGARKAGTPREESTEVVTAQQETASDQQRPSTSK